MATSLERSEKECQIHNLPFGELVKFWGPLNPKITAQKLEMFTRLHAPSHRFTSVISTMVEIHTRGILLNFCVKSHCRPSTFGRIGSCLGELQSETRSHPAEVILARAL